MQDETRDVVQPQPTPPVEEPKSETARKKRPSRTAEAAQSVLDDRTRLVQTATEHRGVPYAPGGRGPEVFDGAGFITVAALAAGLDMGPPNYRDAERLYADSTPIVAEQAESGDLVFFWARPDGPPTEVGLYLGNEEMLAAHPEDGVKVIAVSEASWQKRLYGYGRPACFGPVEPAAE